MTNKQITEKLAELRKEYRGSSLDRQKEIEAEANKLKESLVKCSQCKKVFPDDDERVSGFCDENCRSEYWKHAKDSRPTLDQLRDKVKKLAIEASLKRHETQ